MSVNDRDKLNRIEELKSKLFSKNYQTKIEHRDSFTHLKSAEVPDAWRTTIRDRLNYGEKFFMRTSIFKKFFLFSLGFFVLALGYASYMFFAGGNTVSKDNIDISVLGNNFTAGGEDLSLLIGITNRNSSALDLVDLIIEYPKNSSGSQVGLPSPTPSQPASQTGGQTERIRIPLGTIPAGAVHNENVKLVLFGEQGSISSIKISIEYRVEGSNAIFVKEKPYDVSINSTPVNLSVDAPDTVSPNQNVVLDITTSLNATRPVSRMLIKVDYPIGFQFTSAKPAPTLGNNIWSLGDLAPGAEREISITGKMLDVFPGEEKNFRIWSGSQSKTDKSMIDVVFNSLSHSVVVKKPFIDTELFVNGVSEREYAITSKTLVRGEIRFTNNLDTKINDLEISAKILGNAVDRKTIRADRGFYNSSNNTIVWDRNTLNEFREIDPGESGSVSFNLTPLSSFSGTEGIRPDPTITIEVDISGKQAIEGYDIKNLTNSESSVIRIISDLGFATKALYYSGPFKNEGPVPPEVEKETTYTVVWTLTNSANSVSKAEVYSTIPSWMRFIGPISPKTEDLTYNPSTREITWNIGSISKGTGITGAGREVAFQVAFIPSLSQIGSVPTIINDATLTGHDDFANVEVRVNKGSLNTRLDSDPEFPNGGGVVVE